MTSKYCNIALPIHPSRTDQMTTETKRQILRENTKYEKFCK